MHAEGLFIHLTAAELSTLRTEWLACLSAIASGHQSYSIAGRTITRANVGEASKMLAEITYAQKQQAGTSVRRTYNDMSR